MVLLIGPRVVRVEAGDPIPRSARSGAHNTPRSRFIFIGSRMDGMDQRACWLEGTHIPELWVRMLCNAASTLNDEKERQRQGGMR